MDTKHIKNHIAEKDMKIAEMETNTGILNTSIKQRDKVIEDMQLQLNSYS